MLQKHEWIDRAEVTYFCTVCLKDFFTTDPQALLACPPVLFSEMVKAIEREHRRGCKKDAKHR